MLMSPYKLTGICVLFGKVTMEFDVCCKEINIFAFEQICVEALESMIQSCVGYEVLFNEMKKQKPDV